MSADLQIEWAKIVTASLQDVARTQSDILEILRHLTSIVESLMREVGGKS